MDTLNVGTLDLWFERYFRFNCNIIVSNIISVLSVSHFRFRSSAIEYYLHYETTYVYIIFKHSFSFRTYQPDKIIFILLERL